MILKKRLLFISALPLIIAAAWFILRPAPRGLYLTAYGSGGPCLVIERNWLGQPRIVHPPGNALMIERTRGGIVLFRKTNSDYLIQRMVGVVGSSPPTTKKSWLGWLQSFLPKPKTGEMVWVRELELAPSKTVPGDWDVVRMVLPEQNFKTIELPRAYPSLLHRIDDPRALELIEKTVEARRQEWQPVQDQRGQEIYPQHPPLTSHEDLLRLGAALAAAHPQDANIEMLYMDALIAARDFKTLAAEIGKWRQRLEGPSFLRVPFHRAEQSLRAWELSEKGKNANDLIMQLEQLDLATLTRRLPELLRCEGYVVPPPLTIPTLDAGIIVPNFLSLQTLSKVTMVQCIFKMLTGRGEEAARELASIYHLGQMMSGGALIDTLIGVAIRAISANGLGIYALNACERPEQIEALWTELEWLNQREPPAINPRDPAQAYRLLRFESVANFMPEYALPKDHPAAPNLIEAVVRYGVAGTKFQLVRMGAAARGRQLKTGALPQNANEFGPLLPDGPPADPFTSAPLRMTSLPGAIVCYGVGPDGADEQGLITYDPTNGTTSAGDITLEVPAYRQYPFPRGGMKAATKNELLARFPIGLPPDPFADTRGRQLNVIDGPPVYVYSFGPDGDQMDNTSPRPQVAYDPTNGTSSTGDISVQIPGR